MIEAGDLLRYLGACEETECDDSDQPGAIRWLRERSLRVTPELRYAQFAYEECERGDWIEWLVSHQYVAPHISEGLRRFRLIMCDCVELALIRLEQQVRAGRISLLVQIEGRNGTLRREARVHNAIRVARRHAFGNATFGSMSHIRLVISEAVNSCVMDDHKAVVKAAHAMLCEDDEVSDNLWAPVLLLSEQEAANVIRSHIPWEVLEPALKQVAIEAGLVQG